MSKLSFGYNISGRKKEELLEKKVIINKGTEQEKQIEAKELETEQIYNLLESLKKIDLSEINLFDLVFSFREILPSVFDITKEEFGKVKLPDWECLIAQFEEENQYFLQILAKAGIMKGLDVMKGHIGKEKENISQKSEKV